ncbi:MAG: DUF2723 domain-containing protein [Acidobacteria bacterium]|nr:DUF2723 domain-containing protein [Acidobacteriota bacterium]
MPDPPSPGSIAAGRVMAATIVATLAFWAYTQTLLPGVDLGDTGGFQAAVLWPEVSARQAYPLYYALARSFVRLAGPTNPARALNLFSAVWAAAAAGLLTFVCAAATRSRAAGAVAGLLLAFSYTFWSQAVIAEVYSLHLALIGICLLALHAYARQPSRRRLFVFFGVYAVSFGNHLGMILLLVPCALFLIAVDPRRRDLLQPRVVMAAVLIACAGALQYAPNLMAVWGSFTAPEAWTDRLAAFWFDVTKQDWRETMVLGIQPGQAGDRLAMWWFDARQQFGVIGLGLAAIGAAGLWRMSRPWALLVLTAFGITTAFALTYNVGDSHVFFLPAHFFTAFCAGAAAAAGARGAGRSEWRRWRRALALGATLLAFGYAGWRGWSTWPAVDRHGDHRGEDLIARITAGADDGRTLFVSEMNWQLENVLLYTGRYLRQDLAWVRLGDVMPHWPFLVADNHRIGRDVVLTAEAAAAVAAAYGPAFPMAEDVATGAAPLPDALAQVPRGAPYVLTVLTPERPLDPGVLERALQALTGAAGVRRSGAAFELMAGMAGAPPQTHRSSNRPFTERFRLGEEALTVRMDSWLPADTFRRAGFGHVLRGRNHLLIVERGVSLVWLGPGGRPSAPYYAASLFAAEPRYRIPAATLQLAARHAASLSDQVRWQEP